jgi:hypothetical protein
VFLLLLLFIFLRETMAEPFSETIELVHADKLTSDWYNQKNYPTDFADVSFLIQHEFLRREMIGMERSVNELPVEISAENAWKAVYFAKWFVHYFYNSVQVHHNAEEKHIFPSIAARAEIPGQVPGKALSKSRQDLIADLNEVNYVFKRILRKKGLHCALEISFVKERVPALCQDMRSKISNSLIAVDNTAF